MGILELAQLNLVVPIKNRNVNMANAVFESPQALVAPELQADASEGRLAHLIGEYGDSAGCLTKAILVLAAIRAGAKAPPSKSSAVKNLE